MVKNENIKEGVAVKEGLGGRIFSAVNYIFVTLIAMTMLYPILNVLAVSLSDYNQYLRSPWMIIPKGFNIDAYEYVMNNAFFWRSYANTIIITVGGVLAGLILTVLTAYPLSRRELRGKGLFVALIVFTMVFKAGMIPDYLNMKELGLLDTLMVLIVPGSFTAFNCILMINFFKQVSTELIDAAQIDGASEPSILLKVVVPLSKPVMSSIGLFLAVGKWNSYFGAQIYIRDRSLWPVALTLKEILYSASTAILEAEGDPAAMAAEIQPTTIQYASLMVAMVPIMCVYPFLQKYFAKGVMVGSVKG